MARPGLTNMAKIEVVVEGNDVPRVRDLFAAAGVTGYTTLGAVAGVGHGGEHAGRLLFNDDASLRMLITVVPDDKVDTIVAGLRELFEDNPGVVFVSDTWVSRPEYFRS